MIIKMADPPKPSYDSSKPAYDTSIYYELSPKLESRFFNARTLDYNKDGCCLLRTLFLSSIFMTWLVRIINIIVILMLMITIVLCFVQGSKDHSYYLLVCNLIISIIVCSVCNWWYRSGDLGSEKYWFILLIAIVILFQCISFDIFIFKENSPSPTPTTIRTTSQHGSTVPFTWITNIPASTTKKS